MAVVDGSGEPTHGWDGEKKELQSKIHRKLGTVHVENTLPFIELLAPQVTC